MDYFLGRNVEMYIHKVQYYETDKMGITHHSNYIRWMEEARVDMLEKIDFGYDKLEAAGIISPVVGIECEYKESTRFAENIEIDVKITSYTGVRYTIEYEMRNAETNNLVAKGKSKHCFINENGRPIKIINVHPAFDEKMKELVQN
jgi:acyl-CoA thioester hydrolase